MRPPAILRPYRLTDAPALADLVNATRTSEWDMAFGADDVRRWFFDWPTFHPESDSWLAEGPHGALWGAAHVQPEDPQTLEASPLVLRSVVVFVRPATAQARLELARHLLKHTLERAGSLPRSRSDSPMRSGHHSSSASPGRRACSRRKAFGMPEATTRCAATVSRR